MGWLARNWTRGGARCRKVGRCLVRAERNIPGSNPGRVTSFPPCHNMSDTVTFMAKMWNMGRMQTVTSSSAMPSITGWARCSMLDTRFRWVSFTPLGTPVVPELYGRTAMSSGFERQLQRES